MSKRVALPRAIRAIREAKARQVKTAEHDPAEFAGGRVASRALMSYAHLLNVEAGRRRATDDSIVLLAEALQVEIDAISYVLPSEVAA